MNARIIFLTVAVLLIGKVCSGPIDTTSIITPAPTTAVPAITTTPVPTTTTPVPTTTTPVPTTTTTTTTTLAPEADREWEDLVLAGPTVVNYLSLFMVIVSRADQALTAPPEYTVKYIQDINSLRAILRQIGSDMKSAFQGARDDLFRIEESMKQIPKDIKASLFLIQTGTNDILDTLLPYTLSNVARAAKEGSTVSKPTLSRFVWVGLLLEELVTVLASTTPTTENADNFIEANAYANDMKTQWNFLVELFEKFSERADITQTIVSNNFIDPIDQALKSNGFSSQSHRAGHLDKLVPVAVVIDQSSYLLDMMARTYDDISAEHMANQIATINSYLYITVESERTTNQRQLWKNTVSRSVKVARLAQTRHNEFVGTSSNRQEEYAKYFITI